MARGIVIRMFGDPGITGAIENGMRAALPVKPLGTEQAETVEAEIDRQIIQRNLLRVAVNNTKTADDYACMAVRARYAYKHTPRRGRLYGAILAAWALLWYGIFSAAKHLQDWNREA